MAACEDVLSNCVLALGSSLGAVVVALVAFFKAHSTAKKLDDQ